MLTPIGAEVHEWELVPSNFVALERADVVFYNANGSIRIYPDLAKETEEKNSDDTSREWLVEGYEKYNLSGAESLVNGAIDISSSKKLAAAEGALLADDYADKLAEALII